MFLKTFVVVGNVIVGLYCIIQGLKKGQKTGFNFDVRDLFKNVPFSSASGGFWIAAGTVALIAAIVCHFWIK